MSTHASHENKSIVLPEKYTGSIGRGKADLSVPTQITITNSLDEILIFARHEKASDVHLGANKPVIFRQFGVLKNMTTESFNADQIKHIINAILPREVTEHFDETGDAEYVHTISGYGRFRIALLKQRDGWDLTARVIPVEIPKFENTGMPESCANLTKWAQGMVLVTGPAGCGKTTTLSILIEMINQNRHDHIISIEEPIEIVYEPKQCQITQREINVHTLSQDNALRAALREDPDILVISELRDLGTIQLAVSAAETGHLVFGTMNTTNAGQTISRIVDSFPAEEQSIMRNMISESLRGVICQQLIPNRKGTGMVVAYEILIVTSPIANLIRSGKIAQINNAIATNKASGMILMDNSLEELAIKGQISWTEACERATVPATMKKLISIPNLKKSEFQEAGTNGATILNELVQFGILEEVSSAEVRLKPDVQLDQNIIKKIARDDFDKIWVILNEHL